MLQGSVRYRHQSLKLLLCDCSGNFLGEARLSAYVLELSSNVRRIVVLQSIHG